VLSCVQDCPCVVDSELVASLQSVSASPLLLNVSEGAELQSGDTLLHDCSSW